VPVLAVSGLKVEEHTAFWYFVAAQQQQSLGELSNFSNSLHDENNDANDNDRSNDPVSEHFDSPNAFICAVIGLERPVGAITVSIQLRTRMAIERRQVRKS
jgi:hypothetical protein